MLSVVSFSFKGTGCRANAFLYTFCYAFSLGEIISDSIYKARLSSKIGMYTHSYKNARETFRLCVGFFPAKSLSDFHVQTERNTAE